MASAPRAGRRGADPRRAVGAATLLATGCENRRDRAALERDRVAIRRYEDAIAEHARRGGRIVQLEVKPSLRELLDGSIAPPEFAERAGGWEAELERVRLGILAAAPPPLLAGIEGLWDRAMRTYVEAVRQFRAAALAEGTKRETLLDGGITIADRADDLYDEASRLLQRARRRLGLEPTANFPDPDAR